MKKQKVKKLRNRTRVAYQPVAGLGFELRLAICFLQTPSPASFLLLLQCWHFTEDSRFDPCFPDVLQRMYQGAVSSSELTLSSKRGKTSNYTRRGGFCWTQRKPLVLWSALLLNSAIKLSGGSSTCLPPLFPSRAGAVSCIPASQGSDLVPAIFSRQKKYGSVDWIIYIEMASFLLS